MEASGPHALTLALLAPVPATAHHEDACGRYPDRWSAAMPLSGTIILCDHVYQAEGGKFIIAGTHTTLHVVMPDLFRIDYQVAGLHCYLRIRPEQLGTLTLEIRIRDEQVPPWQPPLMTVRLDIPVTEQTIRLVECPIILPSFGLRVDGGDRAREAGVVDLRYSLELLQNGELIASTPLDLHFVARPSQG